jgi:hypothetical protein
MAARFIPLHVAPKLLPLPLSAPSCSARRRQVVARLPPHVARPAGVPPIRAPLCSSPSRAQPKSLARVPAPSVAPSSPHLHGRAPTHRRSYTVPFPFPHPRRGPLLDSLELI